MKKLSNEVSTLVEKEDYGKAQEKAVEYLDGIVNLLASNEEEERKLRRSYLRHLVRLNRRRQYRLNKGVSIPRKNGFLKASLSNPEDTGVTSNFTDSKITDKVEAYTTSEAAEILHVSDQTIRRMCEAGKFPGATRTDGGHWRIPTKHFKVTLNESRRIDYDLEDIRRKSTEGGPVDEFDLP